MIRGFLLRAASLIAFVFTVSACNPSGDTVIGTDFYPGVVLSLQNSSVSVSRPQVISGSSVLVTVSLQDTSGSAFVSTLPVVSVQTSGGGSAGTLSAVTNNGDGTYSSTFNAVSAGSATTIQALVNGSLLTSMFPTITVLSGNFSLSQSVLSISSANVVSGSAVTLTLTVKDSLGNPSTTGGLTVGFSNSGGTSTGVLSPVTDHQNGTYSATFTGIVSGSATTLTATIQGQSITSALPTVTVTDLPPSALTYSSNPATYTKGTAITNNTPTITGGTNTTYSVLPTLPAGLSLNTTTGVISGTPTAYTATASYVVTATNSGGSAPASVSILVKDVPILSYAGATGTAGTVGTAMTVTPTTLNSRGAAITGCAVKALTTAPPAWAAMNSSTCVITGTPTGALASTTYTIDATNSAGSSTDATVSLSAVYPAPTLTSIAPNSGTRNGGTAVTIAGTGFYSGLTVTLGGTACASITVTSTTQITCTTPAHIIGAVDLVVTNSGTTAATLSGGFTFTSVAATQNWDFNTASQYTYDHTKIDFTGGVAELTASSQTDNSSNCTTGFGDGVTPSCGGTSTGTVWDATNSYVRLDHAGTATDLELDSTWTPAWSNIITYLKLNDNVGTSPVVDSGPVGTNTATVNNTVTLGVAGKLKTAATFDGSSGYLDAGTASSLNNVSQFTISMWVKVGAATNYASLWGKSLNNSTRITIQFVGTNGTLQFIVGDGTNSIVAATAAGVLGTGVWHHLVTVFDGTQSTNASRLSLYIDGISQTLTPSGTAPATTGTISANLLFGRERSTTTYYFNGSLDDIAVWTAALSASAVATIYQHESAAHAGTFTSRVIDGLSSNSWTSFAPVTTLPYGKELPDTPTASPSPLPTPSPVSDSPSSYSSLGANLMGVGAGTTGGIVGLWHLDEAAGTSGTGSILDRSGNGNNGTPTSVTFGVTGKIGTAASFPASSKINVGNASTVQLTTAVTLAGWFNTTTSASSQAIIARSGGTATTTDYELRYNMGPAPFAMTSTIGGTQYLVASTGFGAISTNTWYHVVGTYDGSNLKIYVNGVFYRSLSAPGTMASYSTPLLIGNRADTNTQMLGLLDEVGIWSRALSASEILELYRQGANRIRYQVRSCPDSTCSTSPTWLGPDGSNQTYFSELNNGSIPKDGGDLTSSDSVNATSPSFAFSNFVTASPSPSPFVIPTNRYFQYRTIMESDDVSTSCNYGGSYTATWCSPELQSVVVGPTHYDTSAPTVSNITGVSYATLTSPFTPTTSCSSNTLYNLSPDGTNWYYYSGGVWAAADGSTSKATLGGSIDAPALAAFTSQYGAGNIFFRVFLQTNVAGTNSCSIDNLALGITQ